MNETNNYNSQMGSPNTGKPKHLTPSSSFLHSGTSKPSATTAQPSQTYTQGTQSAQAYSQPTQTTAQTSPAYTQSSAVYSQPTHTTAQASSSYTQSPTAYGQPTHTTTQAGSSYTQSSSAYTSASQTTTQPYAQSSQAYAQTGRVQTSTVQSTDSSNLFLGIIGMLLGLALATVLIVLTYSLNYFSKLQVIASCFTYTFAVLGYSLLGRGVDFKGRVVCSIATLIMVFFAHEIAVAWHLQKALGDEIDFVTTFQNLRSFLDFSPELKGWYYMELAIAYVLNIVCVIAGPKEQLRR